MRDLCADYIRRHYPSLPGDDQREMAEIATSRLALNSSKAGARAEYEQVSFWSVFWSLLRTGRSECQANAHFSRKCFVRLVDAE
jgi:hypothetical protein